MKNYQLPPYEEWREGIAGSLRKTSTYCYRQKKGWYKVTVFVNALELRVMIWVDYEDGDDGDMCLLMHTEARGCPPDQLQATAQKMYDEAREKIINEINKLFEVRQCKGVIE